MVDSNALLLKLQPLGYTCVLIAITVSLIKSIIKGEYKGLLYQVIICSIIAFMISDTSVFKNFGEFVIELIKDLFGSLFKK